MLMLYKLLGKKKNFKIKKVNSTSFCKICSVSTPNPPPQDLWYVKECWYIALLNKILLCISRLNHVPSYANHQTEVFLML